MSRIGKQPIELPEKTTVTVENGDVVVTGPGGTLSRRLHPLVSVSVADGKAVVEPKNMSRQARALWGTFASHIRSMVLGVTEPFTKRLIVEGVGFRAAADSKELTLNVGFSHPVVVPIPEGLTVTAEKEVITVSGIDKEQVGAFAALVRSKKKPEPYKGKGIRYDNEVVRRKQGKKAVGTI